MTSGTAAGRGRAGGAGGAARGWVVWIAASLAVLTLWPAYISAPSRGRLDAFAPFAQLLALRPWPAAAFVILGLLGIALKRRRRSVAAAFRLMTIGALIACAQIAPRALSRAEPVPRGAPTVTVLATNTLRSSVVVGLVRHTDADVIALPETSAEAARSLARALTRDRGERWRAFGDPARRADDASPGPTSIVVREALGPRRLAQPAGAPGALGQVRLGLTRLAGGQLPGVAAVHPRAPAPVGSERSWLRDLLALRALCRAGWILAGDFNATIDHSPMRALLDAGCSDAAASTGQGLKATWSAGPLALVRVPIDHVLSSGRWRASRSGVLRIEGSDHRAVWAQLALVRA